MKYIFWLLVFYVILSSDVFDISLGINFIEQELLFQKVQGIIKYQSTVAIAHSFHNREEVPVLISGWNPF